MKKIILCTSILAVFATRFHYYERTHYSSIPQEWFEHETVITGIITSDPDRGLEKVKIIISPVFSGVVSQKKSISNILITLPSGTKISYGDQILLTGIVKHPEAFNTDTGRIFDYPKYLAVHDIYGTMQVNEIETTAHHQGSRFLKLLFSIKKYFVDTIRKLFPRAQAGLFAGIIIGEKSLLPKEVLADFQIAGLTHMVVLSGFNITIVAIFMVSVLSWLGCGYRTRRLGAFVGIPIFVIMTGMGASSVRAAIMSLMVFGLQIATRPAHSLRVIMLTAGIMIIVNPRILLYDPSFHMSFLAFIGLIYVTPLFKKNTERFGEWLGLKNLIIETMAVQVFVMPYIFWMNGQFSILLLLSNILTVPLVSLVMGAGFSVVIIALVIYPLGYLIALPITWGLSYILFIAHVTASIDWAIFMIPPFPVWIMITGYLLLIRHLVFWYKENGSK